MPTVPDALLAFAHRLLCAAVIAHGDRGGGELLFRPGSPPIEELVTSAERLRLAMFVHARHDELDTLVGAAGEVDARELVAIWSHAVAGAALDAATPIRALLSPREFALLRALMRHPGITLTRQQLREHAWPDEPDIAANTVDVYIGYLRRKLGADTIRTVRGVGYQLDPKAAEALR